MNIRHSIAGCLVFLLFSGTSSAAQTDPLNMSDKEFATQLTQDNLDTVIGALAKESYQSLGPTYFERLKQLIRYIDSPAFSASPLQRFQRVHDVAVLGLEPSPEDAKLSQEVLPAQRDLCLDLMNQRLLDILDGDAYAILRAEYGQVLVAYLEGLKRQVIENYRPRPVMENVPVPSLEPTQHPSIAGMDPLAITDERLRSAYIAEIEANTAAYLANQHQAALRRSIEVLQPSIEDFLKYQYANPPENGEELAKLLRRVRAGGPDRPNS